VGTGILYVYMDEERTIEAPTDEHGNYLVLSGVEYYFSLNGVTEYPDTVKIWGSYWDPPPFWEFTNILIGEFEVSENIDFAWTSAKPTCFILPLPRKLFVVNEIIFGPLGAIAALFIGYTIKTLPKRKRQTR